MDDDEAALLALSEALQLRLHEAVIDTAVSCESAVEHLRSQMYGVIISDVVMPGHDGLAGLAFLNAVQQLCPEVPMILVTGHPGHEEAALCAGAYAFLDKPFNMTQLISVIRSALERRHLQRRLRERNEASLSDLRMALFLSRQPV